jgi:hypothetical protein
MFVCIVDGRHTEALIAHHLRLSLFFWLYCIIDDHVSGVFLLVVGLRACIFGDVYTPTR